MAASLAIEEEQGTSRGFLHPHNGYYAGDFPRVGEQSMRLALPGPLTDRTHHTG
jgi:hypothetical protein